MCIIPEAKLAIQHLPTNKTNQYCQLFSCGWYNVNLDKWSIVSIGHGCPCFQLI